MNPESPVTRRQQAKPFIAHIVSQHADDVADLYNRRKTLLGMPRIRIRDLRASDDRLAAHLDALSIAAENGWPYYEASLESLSAGTVFAVAVRAIEDNDLHRLDMLFGLAEASPDARAGLPSAFGWLGRNLLRGIVASLIASQDAFRRSVGIAACSMHRVDPGLVSARRIVDTSPMVRARALRTAGEIGCQEAIPACAAAIRDADPACGLWAAWSSVLLGNRAIALEVLTSTGLDAGPHRFRALRLALQAVSITAAHQLLRQLAKDPAQLRWLVDGSGIAGDPAYVPWLINHMRDDKVARLAGEALTLITGLDLSHHVFKRPRPEDFESGPTDNPEDENVEMDPDDGLPWPDPDKVEKWWAANASRFQKGIRYFMGAPVTREHCIDVLKNGYQRERILAAHYLCLLDPGTPLFNTSAPAWRQQRLLAKM